MKESRPIQPPDEQLEQEIDEELQLHLDLQAEHYTRRGLPAEAARRRAAERFGKIEPLRHSLIRRERADQRHRRIADRMRTIWRDARAAGRSIRRNPMLAASIVGTLALAIGVATSLLTIVNELVLRPVPGVRQDGLVKVYVNRNGELDGFAGHAFPAFEQYAARSRALSRLAAFSGRGFAVSAGGTPTLVLGTLASGSFFDTLGTRAAVGRLLGPDDDRPESSAVAVVTHAFWQDSLGGDPDVLGRQLQINRRDYAIVGVTEQGFRGPFIGFPSDLFVPLRRAEHLAPDLDLTGWGDGVLEMLGAISTGTSIPAAQNELDQLTRAMADDQPEAFDGRSVSVRPWNGLDADLAGPVLGFVGLLTALACLVAIVAFVNVGGLLIHRGQARRGEFAVRQALGASRQTLIRQLVIETLLLFATAQLVGVMVAGAAARGLLSFLPGYAIPIQLSLAVDWRVLALASGLTFVAAVLFGIAPGLHALRVDPVLALKPSVASSRRGAVRRVLVAAQFAACLVLLVTAALFARTLWAAGQRDTGVADDALAVASADTRVTSESELDGRRFFDTWRTQTLARPEVTGAALTSGLPLALGVTTSGVDVEGQVSPPGGHRLVATTVSSEYFAVAGVRVIRGRGFGTGDRAGTEPVAVISQATADRLFGLGEPVGAYLNDDVGRVRIVGVVSNVALSSPGDLTLGHYYVPWAQRYAARLWLVARGDAVAPTNAVHDAAREADPLVPLLRSGTMADRIGERLFAQRLAAAVASTFGVVGGVLALVGLYGVVAFHTAQRRREFGIRVALGARRSRIRRMVLADGLRQATGGIVAGLAIAFLLAASIRSLLPGVAVWDPIAFAGVSLGLLAAAIAAADLPARRAATTDPMTSLRRD